MALYRRSPVRYATPKAFTSDHMLSHLQVIAKTSQRSPTSSVSRRSTRKEKHVSLTASGRLLWATAPGTKKLNVHVQVNTSGEATKSGCSPGEGTISLCKLIVEECTNLKLIGLMTIGAIARSQQAGRPSGVNEDFLLLQQERAEVCNALGIALDGLELSMGMSEDFEYAVRQGSGEVRVGSTIFGQRPNKADAVIEVDPDDRGGNRKDVVNLMWISCGAPSKIKVGRYLDIGRYASETNVIFSPC